MSDPVSEFRDVLSQAGLIVDAICQDGSLNRCGTVGKERGRDGAYIYHSDFPQSGWWQNFRTGRSGTWTHANGSSLTSEQRETLKRRIEQDRAAKRAEAAQKNATAGVTAAGIWKSCSPAPSQHPYLIRKGVRPVGDIRVTTDGLLVLPITDTSGQLQSLQFISSDGQKRFLTGGRIAGCFFEIPGIEAQPHTPLFIVEGYATGASVHLATNASVLVVFNAGNLPGVARIIKQQRSDAQIILCADDDHETEGNPGLTKATEAALAINAKLAVPKFADPTGKTDFNDLHAAEGLEAVKKCFNDAVHPGRNPGQTITEEEPPEPVPFDDVFPPAVEPETVPEPLRSICWEVAEAIQVPFELALTNALGCVAVAVQRKIHLVVRPDYSEPLALYILCPLPPGERKSATKKFFRAPLETWQHDKRIEMTQVIRAMESELKTREKVIDHKRSMAAKSKTPEALNKIIQEIISMEKDMPELPVIPRLLADDFTPEALAPLIKQHDQRIGVIESEGGLFDILGGRYSKGVPNLDAVLKFWSGEPCSVDRQSRELVILDDPHLSMVISPQPEIVKGLAARPAFRGRGLLGRFLYFMPKSRLGNRDSKPDPIPAGTTAAWHECMERLLNLPWAKDKHGSNISNIIRLTPEALDLWTEFSESVEKELRPGGKFESMTDWTGKFPGQINRIAGLLHAAIVKDPHLTDVSAQTMQYALNLAESFALHARATYGFMGSDADLECAQAILHWIKRDRQELFTARDALRAVRSRFPKMSMINSGLSILEERACIFEQEVKDDIRPGRKKSKVYAVNKKLWRD